MHVAAAQGVKTIGLFGPNLPVRWHPFGRRNISLYKKVGCSPCINTHLGQVPECKWEIDSKEYKKCMNKITVDDVMKAVGKIVR